MFSSLGWEIPKFSNLGNCFMFHIFLFQSYEHELLEWWVLRGLSNVAVLVFQNISYSCCSWELFWFTLSFLWNHLYKPCKKILFVKFYAKIQCHESVCRQIFFFLVGLWELSAVSSALIWGKIEIGYLCLSRIMCLRFLQYLYSLVFFFNWFSALCFCLTTNDWLSLCPWWYYDIYESIYPKVHIVFNSLLLITVLLLLFFCPQWDQIACHASWWLAFMHMQNRWK